MKVLIMRHGKTCWNEKRIMQGWSKNRLSKTGVAVTKEQAEVFANEKIDVIFCSPLVRTVQTANLMNAPHKVKIIKDDRLMEVDQGIFTGRKKSSLTEEEIILKANRSAECGMESKESLWSRTEDFLNYLKTLTYQSVLVVTHDYNSTMLEAMILGKKIEFSDDAQCKNFKNAEVKTFEI